MTEYTVGAKVKYEEDGRMGYICAVYSGGDALAIQGCTINDFCTIKIVKSNTITLLNDADK